MLVVLLAALPAIKNPGKAWIFLLLPDSSGLPHTAPLGHFFLLTLVFLAFASHQSEHSPEGSEFLPWAMRFAQVQAMAHLSRRRRQEDRLIVDDALAKIMADEAAYEEPLFEARRRALADCLQKLPARHRDLVSPGR